jgi:Tfp pilus assembly protein PilO
MNRLNSLKLDSLRRPVVFISIIAVVVLALVWWFFWMSPEGSKISTDQTEASTLQGQLTVLNATLARDKVTAAHVTEYAAYLNMFSVAVPPAAEAAELTNELTALAISTGVEIQQLADDTVTVGTPLSEVPVSVTVSGKHKQCEAFLAGMYKLPRLITITQFTPSPAAGANSGVSVNILSSKDNSAYSYAIAGNAYYSPTIDPSAAATTTTTTAPAG